MLFRVQHLVGNLPLVQQVREVFGFLHRGGADQDRLTAVIVFFDVLNDRVEFRFGGFVHHVVFVLANHGFVRGNRHHAHLVNIVKFGGLSLSGTGHAGTRALRVETHVVLQSNRG